MLLENFFSLVGVLQLTGVRVHYLENESWFFFLEM